MVSNYTGWKLFDKVTIVAKKAFTYNYQTRNTVDSGYVQGYVVDPSNKKQLETARAWGITKIYEDSLDENNQPFRELKEYRPEEYTYDNEGFKLTLCESAEGSSQGGKLSFWNWWITAPDSKKFLVGISADLLLDVLKSTVVVKGTVQDDLMFARCKGGLGMLSKSMDSYRDAIKDESTKKTMSSGKTKKHKIGYVYETVTQSNVYAGKLYRWYEPLYDTSSRFSNKLIGFKKLDKPIELAYFPDYYEEKTKLSDYKGFGYACYMMSKLPARRESTNSIELDITMDELIKSFQEDCFWKYYYSYMEKNKRGDFSFYNYTIIGISEHSDCYTLSDELRRALLDVGYKIIE